jgi:PAS domain S-box-containing protein
MDTIVIIEPHTMRYLKWNKAATRMRDGTVTINLTHINKDGSRTTLEYTGAVSRDMGGDPQYLIFIGRDITERVQAQEALRKEVSERKTAERELQSQIILFDSMLDTTADTIEIFDPDTLVYIKWNKACTEITGYSDEEFATMNPTTSFFDEADAQRIEAGLEEIMRAGHTIVTADIIAKDGTRIPMEFLGSLARDAEGNPRYFISIGRDITERKLLEEKLEESATAAERQRLARELHDSVTQSLYSLDLFANAAHEALSKGKIESASKNTQQVRKLSQIALADMRLFIFELHPSALDELGLAGALRARLESVERRSGIKANIEVKGEGVLERCCDETEFYAIASEALNNTLKHAHAKNITVIIEENNRLCRLSVTDDGTGFDPQNPENEGGYGLKNMRARAEKLGGGFSLETSPGEGTTIRVEVSK